MVKAYPWLCKASKQWHTPSVNKKGTVGYRYKYSTVLIIARGKVVKYIPEIVEFTF
jgi:hypothetical protein